jgi:hypothetical protein
MFILFNFIVSAGAFCHIHAATTFTKKMMMHSKPTSLILINNLIEKYSKQSGVPGSTIKGCIESKKKKLYLRGRAQKY